MTFDTHHASWIEAHRQEHLDLLLTLAQIPAPSNREEKRAGSPTTSKPSP